jgi:sugar O-acyltransferase (sialic acid O-acetyltransferase NeuD family)
MQELNLLGISLFYLPVIFDIAYETMGIKNFHIIKNIPVEGKLMLNLNKDFYHCTLHEPDEWNKFIKGSLFFGVTGPKGKATVYDHFKNNYKIDQSYFINLIHPSSYLATAIELKCGILIEPGVIISSQTEIGFGVTIKRGVSIGHHNNIEEYAEINPGVIISGNVHIGRGCILGAGSVIKNQVSIGDNTFIGMGSVVTKNIPGGVIAYGNPCEIIKENDKWKI